MLRTKRKHCRIGGPPGSCARKEKHCPEKHSSAHEKTFAIFGPCRSVRAQDSKLGLEFACPYRGNCFLMNLGATWAPETQKVTHFGEMLGFPQTFMEKWCFPLLFLKCLFFGILRIPGVPGPFKTPSETTGSLMVLTMGAKREVRTKKEI